MERTQLAAGGKVPSADPLLLRAAGSGELTLVVTHERGARPAPPLGALPAHARAATSIPPGPIHRVQQRPPVEEAREILDEELRDHQIARGVPAADMR